MPFKKVILISALLGCAVAQAETAPTYSFIQGSVERLSQSDAGDDGISDTGFGLKGAWQFNDSWFVATEWQRFNDSESESETYGNDRLELSSKLTFDRYYLGAGYILPVGDTSNLSIATYFGSYRVSAKSAFSVHRNNQQAFSGTHSSSSTKNSLKAEIALRSNLSSNLELSGRAYYEYLNMSGLEDKSQHGVGVGAQYHFSSQFALTAEVSYSKLLDESTTQLGAGLRYNF